MAAIADAPQKVREVKNVHNDDIHGMILLRDRTIITGSKDGALKKWDLNGRLVKVVYDPGQINYQSWITALSPLGPDCWLSGTRDGYIHSWSLEGKELQQIRTPRRAAAELGCKQRNIQRINCLADFTLGHPDLRFVTGRPTQFTIHPAPRFQAVDGGKTSDNDWVYAVHPFNENSLVVATGGRLDLLEKKGIQWLASTLAPEGAKMNGQRSFISSITALRENPSLLGLSIFNGQTAVYNLETKKMVMAAREHTKRVWTIENVSATSFATCADDGLIKLWDIREKKSVATIVDSSSRVSVLISPQEHRLISGSCPEDVWQSAEKARLCFWDLRK